jgi:gamma-tubulin complex component 2
MVSFIQQTISYLAYDVFEKNWLQMERNLRTVTLHAIFVRILPTLCQCSTVDDVLGYHADFLNTCLKESTLTNPYIVKVLCVK